MLCHHQKWLSPVIQTGLMLDSVRDIICEHWRQFLRLHAAFSGAPKGLVLLLYIRINAPQDL